MTQLRAVSLVVALAAACGDGRGSAGYDAQDATPPDGAPPGGAGGKTAQTYQLTGSMSGLRAAIETKPSQLTYAKIVIHDQFLAESCAIGDYNDDGVPDVSSGRHWYEGTTDPQTTFKAAHAFRSGHGPLPRAGHSSEIDTGVSDDWADYALDVDADGWMDIVNVASPDVDELTKTNPKIGTVQPHATAYWYENPGPALAGDPTWTAHLMHDDVRLDAHAIVDVDIDGFPELLGVCKGCPPGATKGYYRRDPSAPAAPWTFQSVGPSMTFPFGGQSWVAGFGGNDFDGDGRPDLIERHGIWVQGPGGSWSQNACVRKDFPGPCFLRAMFSDGSARPEHHGPSHMYATDMDGDGLSDVVAAEWIHNVGLYWYRQQENGGFTRHQFLGGVSPAEIAQWGAGFSQPVALQVVDMDADGAPDVISGKMRYALPNGYGSPDLRGTPYIYVFKNVRGKPGPGGGPITLEPHKVDGDPGAAPGTPAGGMGVGRQIAIGHVNTDGILDICVATKVGLAVFLGE
jgi:hypothetical protein